MKQLKGAVKKANIYIENNMNEVVQTYRHKYHLMPPLGWVNDPNGFCTYKDEYHLFYQYHPYSTAWGPMHWGHAKSEDMISWKDLPVALAPSEDYDRSGVFSGSSFVNGDELRVYYTGHQDSKLVCVNACSSDMPEGVRQVQCLATSNDGITFEKYSGNPVIGTEQIPDHLKDSDFRDPKVWKHLDIWYMAVGAKTLNDTGEVIFYKSRDGISWTLFGNMALEREYGTVCECPDFFELNDKHVLLVSPQNMIRKGNRYENIHASIALIGELNYETGRFEIESIQELDAGFDFYAPQTILDLAGERVMIAWMNMWERTYILDKDKHGWNGSMTLPRKLEMKDGKIVQWTISALEKYRRDHYKLTKTTINEEYYDENLKGNVLDLEMSFSMNAADDFEMIMFADESNELSLKFDKKLNEVYLSRAKTNNQIISISDVNDFIRSCPVDCSKEIRVRIILDVCSAEIFLNQGESVMTTLFFSGEEGNNIIFKSSGQTVINYLSKWELA